jgi:hypothetical protein
MSVILKKRFIKKIVEHLEETGDKEYLLKRATPKQHICFIRKSDSTISDDSKSILYKIESSKNIPFLVIDMDATM